VTSPPAICVALVDDYDIVLLGLARMFDNYRDRITIAEIDANRPVSEPVDIALYDSFAQSESDGEDLALLIDNPNARKVVVYTWNLNPSLIKKALARGVDGYLSKTLTAAELVAALETVHAGEVVISEGMKARITAGLDWPGRTEGLTERESEILAFITQGRSNAEVAALMYLSPNTVKSYIRVLYRKIDVSSRTQAVLWGVDHGFTPDHHRIASWR